MVPADIHDFFLASAGVAGALIGLLFVAISVSAERLARLEASAQLYRIRAYSALVSFTNALAVSLFALIPGHKVGPTSLIVAIVGLLFVLASLLSLVRVRVVRLTSMRDTVFLIGLAVTFVLQLNAGIDLLERPGDSDPVETIAILVIVSFLVGVSRAWELIGGPSIGFAHEVAALVRGGPDESQAAGADAGSAAPVGGPGGRADDGPGSGPGTDGGGTGSDGATGTDSGTGTGTRTPREGAPD